MEQTLRRGLGALGLSQAAVPALTEYGGMLLEKNKVMNLTGVTEPEALAQLHFLDAAAVLSLWDFAGKSVVDVGAGAGVPGLALKLMEPAIRLTLLDAQGKRVAFLKEVCRTLAPDTECVHDRAETFAKTRREGFDIAVSRAVARMNVLCELCLPLVRPGGWFLAMKSLHCGQELQEAQGAVARLGGGAPQIRDYQIPGTAVRHRLVLIQKERPTPKAYPRPFGRIKKEPL